MVARRDTRPTDAKDSLRQLLEQSRNKNTGNFGQKVAQPGEGTTFFDTAGVGWRWDGDVASAYETRISEGEQAVSKAAVDLAQTQEDLAAASGRIDEASKTLLDHEGRIEAADQRISTVGTTLGQLEDTVSENTAAQDQKISEAQKAAQDAADELEQIKQQIADAANGGPATSEQLQQAIQSAKAEAEAASRKAQDALRAAGLAQDTANGKATVTYTSGNPAGVGVAVGDTHYKVDGKGTVLAWWRWDGSAWVPQSLDGSVVASLDAGKITAGTLDSARIKAGSITADKLTVGVGDEVVANGDARSEGVWGGKWSRLVESPPAWGLVSADGKIVSDTTPVFPVPTGGGRYKFKVRVKAGHAGSAVYVRRESFDAAGAKTALNIVSKANPSVDGWSEFTAEDDLPADAVGVRFVVSANHTDGNQAADTTRFTGFSYRRMVQGELIVNGAVTADKVTVDGTLAARVVDAMDANVKRLVVTEDAVIQHATLLGSTVAEQLNVTKTLIARNAIVDGTLDVAQLNVTEGMSAAIVKAMSVESKKLVVTEDAILQRATVIQGLVTSQLIAERINVKNLGAQLITSGSLQTDSRANRGLKMDSNGIRLYNDQGSEIVTMREGFARFVADEFTTGVPSDPRISITTRVNTAPNSPAIGQNVINFIPMYADQRPTHGIMSYDAQGAFTFSVNKFGDDSITSPSFIIRSGGVDVGTTLSVKDGMRMSRTFQKGTFKMGDLSKGAWGTYKFTFPYRLAERPFIYLMARSAGRQEFAFGFYEVSDSGFSFVWSHKGGGTPGYTEIDFAAIVIW